MWLILWCRYNYYLSWYARIIMKTYLHKLYTIQWDYIRTLSPRDVFHDINTEQSIDSWVATYNLTINKKFDDPIADNEYILIVEEYDEINKDWWTVFCWSLDQIKGSQWNDENILEYSFWWLHRLMSVTNCPFSNYTNAKVKDLVQQVVDTFNAEQQRTGSALWWAILKNWVTDETLITKTVANSWLSCIWQLQDIMKLAWWFYFFVTPDWTIVWWPKPTTATYKYQNLIDIKDLKIDRVNILDIRNRVKVQWHFVSNVYNDLVSQSLYWVRYDKVDVETDDITTQNQVWQAFLDKNAFWNREIQCTIKLKDYKWIYPGQTIKILNTNLDSVDNLQIQKTKYDWNTMTLYLEKYKSLVAMLQ